MWSATNKGKGFVAKLCKCYVLIGGIVLVNFVSHFLKYLWSCNLWLDSEFC